MKRARQRNKIKMGPIIVIIGLVLAGVYFGITKMKESGKFDSVLGEAKAEVEQKKAQKKAGEALTVAVVPFGGYAGLVSRNGGANPSKSSKFWTEDNVLVDVIIEEDPAKSLDQWKNDKIDIHWYTVGAFSTKFNELATYQPKFIIQSDYSRGGDIVMAVKNLVKVSQLKGRKVIFVRGDPSHTSLLALLKANNMSINDIIPVPASTPVEAAQKFINGEGHAACVWAPDDEKCLRLVPGSTRLATSKEYTHVIADAFFVKQATYDAKKAKIDAFVQGWLLENGYINSSNSNIYVASAACKTAFGGTDADWVSAIKNVRLCTYNDNKNFFGLNPTFKGQTADKLYKNVSIMYTAANMTVGGSWGLINNPGALLAVDQSLFNKPEHAAEKSFTFEKKTISQAVEATTFATSTLQLRFSTGSATLSPASINKLELKLAPTLEEMAGAQIRIEGHTDNTGGIANNNALSKRRAQSIADFFINEYGMDANRFIVIGKGPSTPIADNGTAAGRAKNRRVECHLLKN